MKPFTMWLTETVNPEKLNSILDQPASVTDPETFEDLPLTIDADTKRDALHLRDELGRGKVIFSGTVFIGTHVCQPSQAVIVSKRVEYIASHPDVNTPIIVATINDQFVIIDGHHRWVAAVRNNQPTIMAKMITRSE